MNEFVIEKYIEVIKDISISMMYKFMLIQILTLFVLLCYSVIYSKRILPKKVKLIAVARGYREHK